MFRSSLPCSFVCLIVITAISIIEPANSASGAGRIFGRRLSHNCCNCPPACACSPQQNNNLTPQAEAITWKSLFDGKSLEENWTKTNFGTEGEIEVENGQITIGFGDGCSGINYNKNDFPKKNYEVELDAMRVSGHDFFCGLTFPVDESHCTFVVGGWSGPVVGLSCINGDDAMHNDTRKLMDFDKKRWYKIRVRVVPERIAAWIDNDTAVDRDIRGEKISLRGEVESSKPLGIATYQTTGAIKNIRYRLLSDKEIAEFTKQEKK
jgi:hypothetical protein